MGMQCELKTISDLYMVAPLSVLQQWIKVEAANQLWLNAMLVLPRITLLHNRRSMPYTMVQYASCCQPGQTACIKALHVTMLTQNMQQADG